eukprot:TRINITY_DN50225_c0_g1_i18.p1 TRINITY_DN50225_c0_g1~~TRINITY_DN50225_c0_g1_i18.p1  ORF type:complete len:108 (+),score=10.80 TRINITY_DN50225_c0_g1_i18:120-443(+)
MCFGSGTRRRRYKLFRGPVDGLPILDGLKNLDVLDGHRLDLQRAGAKHHEVGALANFDRPFTVLFAILTRSVDRDRSQSLEWRDPLFQIGRAVQQECRDRSRMPSSA